MFAVILSVFAAIALVLLVILDVFEVILVFNPLSAFVALVVSAVILAILAFTLLVKVISAALSVVASEVIAVVFAVILTVFDATVVGKPAIVAAVIPPTLLTVGKSAVPPKSFVSFNIPFTVAEASEAVDLVTLAATKAVVAI